jgi:ABC-type transport system involved in multi-copper enzyme maturation permease subunit
MADAVRAEFLKIRKRPATWVLLGLVIGDVLFWQYFLGFGTWLQIKAHVITAPPAFSGPLSQSFSTMQVVRAVADQVSDFGTIALILGALVAGSGYGWGTVKTDFTAGASRLVIFAAQFLILATLFVPLVPLLFAVAVGLTVLLSSTQHFPMLWPPVWQFPAAMGAIYLSLVVNMAFGLMTATLTRSAAFGIALGMISTSPLALIGLFSGPLAQGVEQWLPWSTAFSLTFVFGPLGGGPNEVLYGVPGNAAVPILVVAAYTLAFLAAGGLVLRRRDVT